MKAKVFISLLFICFSISLMAQRSEETTDERPVIRAVPDSVVEKMKREKGFEYANDPSFWLEEKREEPLHLLNG